ncbi:unnamed protein product [Bursaphelenchus okinawaensis]|uniref:Uncharacterized protein n=1 Tax=Bursaphelenchus okinawaensis TaxID=465554 RepID=A0A811LL77_9BILA|nr:unnamed protein product [Bursaphelenchus okinawaensis]CAG9123751.1 unnamed protein product [Bursaphelenchus okinawaensis]
MESNTSGKATYRSLSVIYNSWRLTVPLKFHGHLQLYCIQDVQNAAEIIDRTDFLVVFGVRKQALSLKTAEESKVFKTNFSFLFRSEGVFKIRPQIEIDTALEHYMEELIVPTVSFKY